MELSLICAKMIDKCARRIDNCAKGTELVQDRKEQIV